MDADVTLDEARDWLRDRVDEGTRCPCCTQMAKVYRRPITTMMARVLIEMLCRFTPGEWVNVPQLGKDMNLGGRGDECKLRYWGLIEPMPDVIRDDGSPRVGMWRITNQGILFAQNRIRVARYAKVYDGRCLGFDDAEQVSIIDALGTGFNYNDLMDR